MPPKNHPMFLAVMLGLLGTLAFQTAWQAISPTAFAQDAQRNVDPDRDHDIDENEGREERFRHLEDGQREIEHALGTFEMARQLAAVVESPHTTAVFAIMHIHDVVEDDEQGIKLLEEALAKTKNEAIRRALRLKLIEFYRESDQMDKAREQLLQIIVGEAH
jgi:hypothetical protein